MYHPLSREEGMKLVEKHLIKPSKKIFDEIDKLAFLSKNLYNCAVYQCRQAFFPNQLVPNFNQLYHLLKNGDDYKALPAKVSQLIIKQAHQTFKSYLAALKAYKKDSSKFLGRPKLPKYKHKEKGRNILIYNYQAVSKKALKSGKINPSGTNIFISTKPKKINVKTVNESYTSKCSFLDLEPIKKQSNYLGKRVKRGLFKSSCGRVTSAAQNGSLNIIRKVVGDSLFIGQPIERLVVSPVRVKPYKASR